jgi:hypothetical protein
MVTGKNHFFFAELSVVLFYFSNGCEIKAIANHRYVVRFQTLDRYMVNINQTPLLQGMPT